MKKYLVCINTPGVAMKLPHNNKTIRTPHDFIIEEKDIVALECLFRVRAIMDYKIEEISKEEADKFEQEVIESNRDSDYQSTSLKKKPELSINGAIKHRHGR